MGSEVIRSEGLSKRYRLGQIESYATLRDILGRLGGAPLRLLRGESAFPERDRRGHVWALRDVSFSVRAGEVVGIIGRNGSGKTTLLKVLSQITAPTSGQVQIRGRVGSLLEVGTGFHPELTGRENVYLSGSILGMSRKEVSRKFDEIVAFSGVEEFLDTPVKRYSSGMYVRLGFSVSAHLEPEILFVDEVLAVGDTAFQKRCREKMQSVSKSGGTILFVSHNMSAVRSICDRTILLDAGGIVSDGRTEDVVTEYLTGGSDSCETGVIPEDVHRIGTGTARIRSVALLGREGRPTKQLRIGEPFRVEIALAVDEALTDGVVEIDISSLDGVYGVTAFSTDQEEQLVTLGLGEWTVAADLGVSLLPGRYTIDLALHHRGAPYTIDFVRRTLDFDVGNVGEGGAAPYPFEIKRGFVRPESRWHEPTRTSGVSRPRAAETSN